MDVESISAAQAANVSNEFQVRVFKGASDQEAAVISTILSGIQSGSRAPEQTGHTLNIAA